MRKSNFVKIWLAILVAVLVIIAGKYFVFAGESNPTLKEVLAQPRLNKSVDLPLFVAGLLAFSFATLSAAKGYEIYKRSRSLPGVLLSPEPKSELSKPKPARKKKTKIESKARTKKRRKKKTQK